MQSSKKAVLRPRVEERARGGRDVPSRSQLSQFMAGRDLFLVFLLRLRRVRAVSGSGEPEIDERDDEDSDRARRP